MKKNYFFYGIAISFLALIFTNSCNDSTEKTKEEVTKDSIAAMVMRGDYLVNNICHCMECHGDGDETKFGNPPIRGTAGKGGNEIEKGLYARNITPYGLGSWTDDEIYKVITTGIRKNGDTLAPIMPWWAYVRMPKEEIYSIIAYLRTLKPIENDVKPRQIDDAQKAFFTAFYKNTYLKNAKEKFLLPPAEDKVKLGQYLVNASACTGCHSKFNPEKLDFDEDWYLAGGNLFTDSARGIKVNTANLTPDTATGLGGWTEEMFLAKFKNYRDSSNYNYNPGKFNTFMPWVYLANAKDEDLSAIYAYLRTIKPVKNKLEKWPE